MKMSRICTSVFAVLLATFATVDLTEATPRRVLTSQEVLRLGTQRTTDDVFRGGGFTLCDFDATLVSENLDISTIIPGNSVNCFGGSGTPEHSYGRSHDLSLGSTAGVPLEVSCVHFGLSQLTSELPVTINIYKDTDGIPGPNSDESDFWFLGSTLFSMPATDSALYLTGTFSPPIALEPDSLIFVEFVIPELFPGSHNIGSNDGGELSPTWLKTTNGECGIGSWVNPSALGFANMHFLEAIEVGVAEIPDPCDSVLPACAEDVDGDGIVAVSDILSIIGNWGSCGDGTFRPAGDIAPAPNGDCCVTVADILAVISSWGVECEPGGTDELHINELRIDHSGTDDNEYVELGGPASTSLDGYSYIVIGDGTGGLGVLETVIDLTGLAIAEDGLLSIGKPEMNIGIPDVAIDGLYFENSDTVTHLLVQGLTAVLGDDLDAEDDGILDGMFWAAVVDSVGLQDADSDGAVNGLLYTDVIIGPNGIYPPAHIFRCPDGGDWNMGVFGDLAMDTPGEYNMCDVSDLDQDGVFDLVDNCYLYNPDQVDCNDNGIGDICDIAEGISQDCNANDIADECEEDCDGNGIPDECDIAGGAIDCDSNGVLDSCEADCNENGIVDACDISDGTSIDENENGVPDECEVGNLLYTSFEEPLIGNQYTDLGDPLVNHQLVNNVDEAMVEWTASGAEMGFTAWYINTHDSVGLTDGDYVGITDYTGSVGSFPEGVQGYQMSDCDGMMMVQFDTVFNSGAWNVSVDMFIASTGWESADLVKVEIIVDGGVVISVMDTTGSDIDDLGIEGAWFNLIQELDGYSEATLQISLDSNAGTEELYIDNIIFSSNAIIDSDGDGIPDSQDNCYLPNPDQLDCNANGIGDVCDLADGMSFDCNLNDIPDECESDCNTNGIPDECDIADGTSIDKDGNGIPDECEVNSGNLIISGVYDAQFTSSAGPKGMELFAFVAIPDLSIYGIGSANNGGGSDGQEFTFPAMSIPANTYIYITDDEVDFLTFFGFAPDHQSGAMSINGDDAFELFENGNVVDTFGDINVDGTGQAWEYLDGWAKRISGTGPDGSTFDITAWSFSGINMLEGETNDTCPTPFVFGGYTP